MRAIRYTLERVRTPNVVRERKTINFLEINLSCHRAQAIFIYFLYTKDSLMPKIYRKGGREWNSNIYRKEALRWTFLWFLSMSLRHSTNLFSWHNKNSRLKFNWILTFFRILLFPSEVLRWKSGGLHYESFNFYCTLNMKSQKSLLCWQECEAKYDEVNLLCMERLSQGFSLFALSEDVSVHFTLLKLETILGKVF